MQKEIHSVLTSRVKECKKQLFVFDEVDKISPDILSSLKPFIDFNHNIDGADFRQSIFIFLSNTGEDIINEKFYQYWAQGKQRDQLTLNDFEKLIKIGVFNEKGGLI